MLSAIISCVGVSSGNGGLWAGCTFWAQLEGSYKKMTSFVWTRAEEVVQCLMKRRKKKGTGKEKVCVNERIKI